MEDLPADVLGVYTPDDLMDEKQRMVEEEKEAYAEAVSLTFSQVHSLCVSLFLLLYHPLLLIHEIVRRVDA